MSAGPMVQPFAARVVPPEELTHGQRAALVFIDGAKLVVKVRGGFGYRRHGAAISHVIGQSLLQRGLAETALNPRLRCLQIKLTGAGAAVAAILRERSAP